MFAPLATALTLLVGITLYAVIQSLFNAYYGPQRRLHVYFAFTAMFTCSYTVTCLYSFHSHTIADVITAQRLALLSAQLLFLSLIGFISEYAHWRPRWLVYPPVLALLVLLFLTLFLPYGLASSAPLNLNQITLPWGETITDIRIQDKSFWWYLFWLCIFGVFVYQFAAALHLRRAGDKQRGNVLFWFGGVFFIAVLANLVINLTIVDFTQMAEFGFIAMIMMMSLHLNRETRSSQQRAEHAENYWSALVNNAPNFIALINPDGIIRFINRVFPGDDIKTILGTHVDKYLPAGSQPLMRDSLQNVITTKKGVNTQLQLGDPRNKWLDVQLVPLLVADEVKQIIIMATDITDQIEIKHKLQLSEAKYRQLLQTLPYGVQEIDKSGVITFSNPAHDRLFGYEPGQMLGMSIFDLTAHENDKYRNYINHIFDTQPFPTNYCKQVRKKNGEVFDLKVDWDYRCDEGGNLIGLISVLSDITQQQQALNALKESEEKFRQLAENINVVFYIRDLASNRILYISPAYELIWGRSREALLKNPDDFIQSIHPDDKTRVMQFFTQPNREEAFFDIEYRIVGKDGEVHWVNSRRYPIKDEHGNIHRIAGIVEDITQRKLTEQILKDRTLELKRTHDFTEAVVDIVGAVIFVMNNKGEIVRFNHACEHVSGYSSREALGRLPWEFLLLPEEREAVKNMFARLSFGNFPTHYENYWLHKDGSKRLIAWSNTCLTDSQGNVEYVIATGVDITEQRQAEAALRESAEKYRTLMEYASDIILIADLDGRLIEGNSSALEKLGYSREELLNLRVPDIHPPEQLPRYLADFQTLVNTGNVVTNDAMLLRRDGQLLPVDITANIIYYQGRKVAVGFMRDISARKQVEEVQKQTERSHREMLVREVHHRIKNNLQGVIGLLRNSLSEEEGISAHSERLIARAITQIGTIAMVHGLQSHISQGGVRVCDVTRAVVDQSRTFAASNIHVEFHDNVAQPALLQEEEAIPLALVINEIMTNAIKHIPATVANKQVIVELKGSPAAGMELLVFNSGGRLPSVKNPDHQFQHGIGLDLIQALLPKQHTQFSLSEDPEAGGVYAKLRIEPAILNPVTEGITSAPQGND